MKNLFKKVTRWLQEWEGTWLLPLTFIIVLWISATLYNIWGPSVGIFPPGLLNGVMIASFAFFTGFSVVNLMINLYHRGWYRYYYKQKDVTSPDYLRKRTARDDFQKLPSWLRVLFIPVLQLILLCLFFWLVVNLI